MRGAFPVLVMVFLFLVACSPKTGKRAGEDELLKVTKTESGWSFDEVRMKKTACYGECPEFEVVIMSDGRALYTGISNVENIGNYESSLTAIQISEIHRAIELADYFTLSSLYPDGSPAGNDFPNTITYVRHGNKEHQVKNNHEAPGRLIDFERSLMKIIDSMDWKRIRKENP